MANFGDNVSYLGVNASAASAGSEYFGGEQEMA